MHIFSEKQTLRENIASGTQLLQIFIKVLQREENNMF